MVAERAGHEQEHAEPEGGGHVGHDPPHTRVRRQRRAKLVQRDARGHRHQGAGAEQRSRLGEHAGHLLRAHGHDHDVRGRDQIGEVPATAAPVSLAAAAAASADTSR